MPESVLSLGEKAGLPPGSVVHVGEPVQEPPRIDVLSYDASTFTASGEDALDDLHSILQSPKVVWIKIQGIHDVGVIQRVGHGCDLHSLVMEDIATKKIIVTTPSDDLNTVLQKFTIRNIDSLPVVKDEDPGCLIGMLNRREVISFYNQRITEIKQQAGN